MQLQDVCRKCLLPEDGAKYRAPQPGFAEQDPTNWYACAKSAIKDAMYEAGANPEDVKG